MVDIIGKIRKLFDLVKNFVAGSNKNYLRLRFGKIIAVTSSRGSMFLNSRKPFLDQNALWWVNSKGNLEISPTFEPNPHIVISGMSGFGKSTLFKSLLLDIRNANVACIIFDAHNEHSSIVRSLNGKVHNALYSGINILELDGASVSERISELSRLFKEIYSLGYIQATKLSECLWYTYRKAGAAGRSDRTLRAAPSIRDLIDELNIFIRNSKSVGERNTLLHLRDRISLLNNSAFNGGSTNMKEINSGLHSFSLSNMKSKESQLIYIGELLNRLYSTMHDGEKKGGLRLYIMIDEAQFLVDNSNNNSIIAKLIEEGRKYGVGVIIVTHAASTLNRKIIANCSAFATFYAREPAEVGYVTKVLSGSNPQILNIVRDRIGNLRQNEALIVSGNFRKPVVVRTPRFDEIKSIGLERPSESEIRDLLGAKAKRPIRVAELAALGIEVNSRQFANLIDSGLLDRFSLEFNGSAEDWFMLHNKSISIEHEVWVRKISSVLTARGLENRIIDNSNGPDIHLSINGKRIAVEYETGSKSADSTRKMMDLRLGAYEVVVVVVREALVQYYKDLVGPVGVVVVSTSEIDRIWNYALKDSV